jgi:hypothetical protein
VVVEQLPEVSITPDVGTAHERASFLKPSPMYLRDGSHRDVRFATEIEDVLFTDEPEPDEAESDALIGP